MIAHVALWTQQLEALKSFYITYFDGACDEKYVNPAKGFESYMLRFGDGCELELMSRRDINQPADAPRLGLCHLAFGFDSREQVLSLTEKLRTAGVRVLGEPRTTGDGYFESVVADPDGNPVEIVSR